ncbi:RNA-binding protein 4B-like isoform X2 [Dinothrombium tinctorium]|uniref:RNA-binding protein 4B-like isoform X2 n=1 Tax=Dinothrombium tinctorium TaxID=1965070 RepID=A0A3S3PSV9_9ACAR|nr:RNA-binding protein 4B-like isoform X2 [Dinothrombium tinctorium]
MTKLFVGRLPEGCTSKDLEELFGKYGKVTECDVVGKFGFVHLSKREEAEECIKKLHKYSFMGSQLSVEVNYDSTLRIYRSLVALQYSTSRVHPEPGTAGRAKGTSRSVKRVDRPKGSYYRDSARDYGPPPLSPSDAAYAYYANDYRYESDLYDRDPYYARERMRPYPSPYERRAYPYDDMYGGRSYATSSLPPPENIYARRVPNDAYDRRSDMSTPMYSTRSPPPHHGVECIEFKRPLDMSSRTKIYVGNIPESCKTEEIRALFEKYGKVEECDVVKNFGFVHMSTEEETKLAIDALNGSEFMGVKITVEASHSKVRPKPGMGGKGQCYRCGKSGHWSKECPRNSYDRFGYDSRAPPPMPPPVGYPDRYGSRYGPVRYPVERYDRGYGRPYPDPYDRRPIPPPRDDYYYRRPYDDYPYSRRSPPRSDRYGDRGYYDERSYSSCSKWSLAGTFHGSALFKTSIELFYLYCILHVPIKTVEMTVGCRLLVAEIRIISGVLKLRGRA